MRPDFSPLYSGLGAPTFASSNPGLEAMQSIAAIRQAQANLTQTQIQNAGQQSLLPGLVPQQQAQTGLMTAQGNQANAMATIGIPAQAVYNRDAGQEALAQGGLYNAQVAAGLPAAQAQQAAGYGALGQSEAAHYNLLNQYPGMSLTNPLAQLMDYNRFLQNQGQSQNAQQNNQGQIPSQQVPNQQQPPANVANPANSQGGLTFMPSQNGSPSMGISATQNPYQQISNQVQGSSMPGINPGMNGMGEQGNLMGSLMNQDGSMNMQAMMNLMGMQATLPIRKELAQANFYQTRTGLPYSGTDQSGNAVNYQPTQPTVVGNVQGRQLGETESNTLIPQRNAALNNYSGIFGPLALAKDTILGNFGNTAAADRASNAGNAINLTPTIATSLARTAAGGSPTVNEINDQKEAVEPSLLTRAAWDLANGRLKNLALSKSSNSLGSGVGSVVNQERGQFASTPTSPSSQPSAQMQLPPMPSFGSKKEFQNWAKSLTQSQRSYYRAQIAGGQ